MRPTTAWLLAGLGAALAPARADDWLTWGRDPSRNMVSPEKNLPDRFDPGRSRPGAGELDPATFRGVKWVVPLGSQTYSNPTVAGGRVFIGTNNDKPRDPRRPGDRGILLCLDAESGRLLWQLAVPKLTTGSASDWELLGLCSSPTVDGDRVYVVTNRCEVVCLDVHGMANGNDGPFLDEARYLAGPGKPPVEIGPLDADLLWRYDMREELGVIPHNISSSAVLVVGGRLYATTSNGRDWTHVNTPSPFAPALICLDKMTGRLLGEEASDIGTRLYHGSWSTPAYGEAGGRGLVIFGAGDGCCYAFDPAPAPGPGGRGVLREIWRYDCNPPERRQKGVKRIAYPEADGPSEIVATPVFHGGRVYVAVGQDPEHGDGVGALHCIDASGTGDITKTGMVWRYDKLRRSLSTVAVASGLVFAADYAGFVHGIDAATGAPCWVHDMKAHVWGSPLAGDGKVYLGDEDGDLVIFAAAREKKILAEVAFSGAIYSTPVAANGILYVTTPTHLYAIGPKKP
jgi:outer membrane protein assembly factor BamB